MGKHTVSNLPQDPPWVEKSRYAPLIATYNTSSPWKDTDISLCWINFDYQHLHKHSLYECFLVVNGELTHYINGKEYKLSTGSACLIRPNDFHLLSNTNPTNKPQQLFFFIQDKYMAELLDVYDANLCETLLERKEPLHFNLNETEMNAIISSARQIRIYDPTKIESNVLQTKILFNKTLHVLFEQTLEQCNKYPNWLINLLNVVNNPESVYTLTEITRMTGYSYSRFAYLFKKHVGISFKEYVTNVKMEYAKELLKNSELSILEISSLLGYDSLSHLYHIFKRLYGYTPNDYRKNQKTP